MADPPNRGWTDDHQQAAEDAGYPSWEQWIREREAELEKRICGRRTRSDKPCGQGAGERTPHPGTGACWLHGGNAKRGKEHGRYKHGKYAQGWSGLYPKSLEEHVEDARDTPEVAWLREMVELLAARVSRQLAEIKKRENPLRPQEFEDVLEETLTAVQTSDPERAGQGMREMMALAQRQREEDERWKEADVLMERLREHVKDLVGVWEKLQQMVHLEVVEEQLVSMVREFRDAVEDEVEDPEVRDRVLRRIAVATGEWAREHERQTTGRELASGTLPTGNGNRPEAS